MGWAEWYAVQILAIAPVSCGVICRRGRLRIDDSGWSRDTISADSLTLTLHTLTPARSPCACDFLASPTSGGLFLVGNGMGSLGSVLEASILGIGIRFALIAALTEGACFLIFKASRSRTPSLSQNQLVVWSSERLLTPRSFVLACRRTSPHISFASAR